MQSKKPANKKKQTDLINGRKIIPEQRRTNRPVSPSAIGRQAASSPQNKRQPVKVQPKRSPKNAPKKNAPKAKASPENKRPIPPNTVQNAQRSALTPNPAQPKPASRTTPPPVKKNAPQKTAKSAKKTAQKRVKRTQRTVQSHYKYHGGSYKLYYMLGGVVAVIAFVILANTVLFRCNTINVSGNLRYTSEEIAERSMIEMGKNLLHINTHRAEENIVSSLAYIDAATVKRSFPTGINIIVTEAEKRFYIRQGNTTAAVSYGGKIIEHSASDGLTVFTGYEPESVDIGSWLKSTTDGKTNMPEIILNAIERSSLENVDEVDLDDRFSIKMRLDGGRVILELGTIAEMESKLMVANKLVREYISPSERVTVLLSNPEQPTVIPETMDDISDDLNNSDDSSDQ